MEQMKSFGVSLPTGVLIGYILVYNCCTSKCLTTRRSGSNRKAKLTVNLELDFTKRVFISSTPSAILNSSTL